MRVAPFSRCTSLAAIYCTSISFAVVGAGGGCQLNTDGIRDPDPNVMRDGAGGDTSSVHVGTGGSSDSGAIVSGTGGHHEAGTGGQVSAGAGGADGGLGGTPSVFDGVGGAMTGIGGSGMGGSGMGGSGMGGSGLGGSGLGGSGVGGSGMGGSGMGGSGVGGSGMGGSGMGGSGGSPPVVVGCADGTREAFVDLRAFPTVAGCAGGWSVPGILTMASLVPACARAAGNNGTRVNGNGCTVEDLCAAGWHVCAGANDLRDRGVRCASSGIPNAGNGNPRLLFATRQRGRTGTTCVADDVTGANDVHGCGNFGPAEDPNCAPLDRQFSHNECDMVTPWSCNNPADATGEALVVVKPGSAGGGVLCCH